MSSAARCRARCSRSNAEVGDEVAVGQVLVVVEAMKMENEIVAHDAGRVEEIAVASGDQVTSGQLLIRIV